jgi:transposase
MAGVPKSTVYYIINRLRSGGHIDRRPGSGQYQQINKNIKDKIIEECVQEVGLSYRVIGRKFKISPNTILIEAEI